MATDETVRDYLFISYATEDSDLAEWLALRLTAEGYKVWCDRIKLLGGESFPLDIDEAIKTQTFRLLALLSHASIEKPNPRKERTIAHSISRERDEDFLIPLNIDGLGPTELDWMTSDLTFIPFDRSWATGFAQLLKKLESINAPREIRNGRASVCDWMAVQATPIKRSEQLRSNLLPVVEIPRVLHQFEITEKIILPKLGEQWPFYNPTNSQIAWAFDPPPEDLGVPVQRLTSLSWLDMDEHNGLRIQDIGVAILRKAIIVKCLQRGMKRVPKSGFPYFPEGLLEKNTLSFTTYSGRKSHVKVSGERTFRKGQEIERVKYHLAPFFHLNVTDYSDMILRIAIRLHLTNLSGFGLEGSKVISRRKRICRNWWNHEWVSRFLAVVEWLCEGQSEYVILSSSKGDFRISSTPLTFSVGQGIDEANLRETTEETEKDYGEIGEEGYQENEQLDEDSEEDIEDE